jgi:hypothetical protein
LNPEKLKALWLGSWHAGMINVAQVGYNDTLDIACCVVVQPVDETGFRRESPNRSHTWACTFA